MTHFVYIRTVAFFFFQLCLTSYVAGQDFGFDPNESIENISISQWTAEDGLSSNNVTSVFQDSKGLLWITSFNGVMIFDGERIEVFDINNLDLLETDGFYTVVENEAGVVYLGSQGSGLVKYENGVFSRIDPENEVLPRSFPSLLASRSGTLYAGSNNKGLYQISNGKASKVAIEALDHSTITSMREDHAGKIWVGTEGQGLFCIVNGKLEKHFTTAEGLLDNYVESMVCTDDELVVVATTSGLQYLSEDQTLTTVQSLAGAYINYLYLDEWNSVWAGTEIGLARWNYQLDKTDWLVEKRGIDLVRISSIIKDNENSIWLTSSRTGLIRLKESMLTNIAQPNLSSDRVNIVHESWNGNLYIGTDQNNMDVWDGKSFKTIALQTDLAGNGIRDIYHDKDGSFWLATYIGIVHKQSDKEVVYSTSTGMPANNFRTILKDQQGDFWFGSRSGGLVKFRDGRILEVFDHKNKLESNFVLSVTEADNGSIYIGTHSGGLTVFDDAGGVKTYHYKADDSGILLFNIDMVSEVSAIITANVGLMFFDGESIEMIDLVSDQRSKTYFDLVVDKNEHLWVSTNLGIIQISKLSWAQYQQGELDQLPYFILDENNGMTNKECTGATRSILSSNGTVLVPTLGGVCEVNPVEMKANPLIPVVCIRNVLVDNQAYNIGETGFSIEAGAMRYVFEFAVLSYTAPERNQFKYKLEGFDQNWSAIGYDGRVEYTNLRPGKYTFSVMGANESGTWNAEAASFSFRVKPFFYQTPWFYLLILVAIVLIFLIIYRWRTSFINRQNNELRKVNAELDRFVYSASHEIRSPLSSILGLINLARMGDADKRLEYFDHIEKSVNRLDEFIHDIVDYSRNARLGLEISEVDFETTISNILDDISHTDNFNQIKRKLLYRQKEDFYSDSKRLKVVLSNIITNAFKHHRPDQVENAFVSIEVSSVKNGVMIEVIDNGPGIEEKHQAKVFNMFYRGTTTTEGSGLGLYIVEETLAKLNGTIAIQSGASGSAFTIELTNLRPSSKNES